MQSDIQKTQASIDHCEELIARREQALRLYDNKDFKELIGEGYFVQEAVRLTGLLGDPNDQMDQEAVMHGLRSVADLRRYLSGIVRLGNRAEDELEDHKDTLDELMHEDEE